LTIKVEKYPDIHSAVIYLNRPERLNAISSQLAKDLLDIFDVLERDTNVWALAIRGTGDKAFCVGADLKERKDMDISAMKEQRNIFVKLFKRMTFFPKPLIAVVNGFAMGGGFEIALCCDFILACKTSVFVLPEVGLGIIPAGGGTQNLARLVGKNRAKEIIFTTKKIGAEEAFELGIVSSIFELSEIDKVIKQKLGEITQNAPLAQQQAKRSINYGTEMDLDSGFTFEAECYNVLLTTDDRNEGLRAFNEKRPPHYRGC